VRKLLPFSAQKWSIIDRNFDKWMDDFKGCILFPWPFLRICSCMAMGSTKRRHTNILSVERWLMVVGDKTFGMVSYVNSRWFYNKHTCREVSPGLDARRVAGSFPNLPSEARWVRETSSRPRCVQSRTHRTCKYVWFLSHAISVKY
jgi:hypothetical protein